MHNLPYWRSRAGDQVADDREGGPSPETLEAVEGCTLLRSGQNGWIELTMDGEGM